MCLKCVKDNKIFEEKEKLYSSNCTAFLFRNKKRWELIVGCGLGLMRVWLIMQDLSLTV